MTDSGKATNDPSPPAGDVGSSGGGNTTSEEGNVERAQHIQENSQMSCAVVPSSTHSTFARSNKCCLSTPKASIDSFLFGRTANYSNAINTHLPNSNVTNISRTSIGDCTDSTKQKAHCDEAHLLQHEPWTVDDAASAFSSMHLSPTSSQVACSPYHAAASVEEWKEAKLPTPSENPLGWQNLDRLACLLLSRVRSANLRQRRASLVFIFLTLERVVARGSASARRHALYRWKTCLGLSTDPAMLGAVPESTRTQMLRLDEVLDAVCDNSKRNDTVFAMVDDLGATTIGKGRGSSHGNYDVTNARSSHNASNRNGGCNNGTVGR
eukprot:GHVS01045465.1.p1 GENE.GHVS01045465.1~~GHVS01045465.1.p1  ORF type:complete len:324 (-),score=38.38 GHVS01045465.1:159-1130(-)